MASIHFHAVCEQNDYLCEVKEPDTQLCMVNA